MAATTAISATKTNILKALNMYCPRIPLLSLSQTSRRDILQLLSHLGTLHVARAVWPQVFRIISIVILATLEAHILLLMVQMQAFRSVN